MVVADTPHCLNWMGQGQWCASLTLASGESTAVFINQLADVHTLTSRYLYLLVVCQREDAALFLKVPDLDGVVSRPSCEGDTRGVEVNPGHPVLVPLAAHDQVPCRHVPHLPGLIIAGCDEDGLGRVDSQVGDREQVALLGEKSWAIFFRHRHLSSKLLNSHMPTSFPSIQFATILRSPNHLECLLE